MKNISLSNKISNVSWLLVMVLIVKLPFLSVKRYCDISKLYSVWKVPRFHGATVILPNTTDMWLFAKFTSAASYADVTCTSW